MAQTRRGLLGGAAARSDKLPESAVVERMRAIVAQSGDSLLLADGPPHPDAKLLELCGDALHHLCKAERLDAERLARDETTLSRPWTDEDRRRSDENFARVTELKAEATRLMRGATKLRARTPSGLFGKALCVRASRTGAQVLAMSLAVDLVECEALRRSLWPSGQVRP